MNLTLDDFGNASHELWRDIERTLTSLLPEDEKKTIHKFYISLDQQVHFFLQTSKQTYWKKVFAAPLRADDIQHLVRDYKSIQKVLRQDIKSLIVFPSLHEGDSVHLLAVPGFPRYFRYTLHTENQTVSVRLEEVYPTAAETSSAEIFQTADGPSESAGIEGTLSQRPGSFFQSARLTEEEILEFIEIGRTLPLERFSS